VKSKPKRKRKRPIPVPWYKAFYRDHREVCAVTVALVGIFVVQAYFSTRFDKDEYQRITGNLVTFAVSAALGYRRPQ